MRMMQSVWALFLIPADLLKNNKDYPVPHMGWNKVHFNRDSVLTKNLKDEDYYYFVHSYYVPICNETIGVSRYPIEFSADSSER